MTDEITEDELRQKLIEKIGDTSYNAYARSVGTHRSSISFMIHGHRPLNDNVLRDLGYERVSVIRKTK